MKKKALGDIQKGESFKFSKRGCVWTAFERVNNKVLNSAIVVKNDRGTVRTYGSADTKWNRAIFVVSE